MALLQGKTPEQMAAEIIEQAKKPVLVEINGVAAQNLDKLLGYKFSKQIYSKGQRWFDANRDFLRTEFIEQVIESQYIQRQKLDAKNEENEKNEYVKLLVSRGVNKFVAMEMAGLITKADVEAAQKIEAEAKAKAEAEAKAKQTK